MDPTYVNVVDPQDMVWTLLAYLVHVGVVGAHVGLATFLLIGGGYDLMRPGRAGRWLRRLGSLAGAERLRTLAALRLALGLMLLAPLAVGAPIYTSLAAAVGAFGLLWYAGGTLLAAGRLARGTAMGCAVLVSAFIVWEREDNLALAADLLVGASEFRGEELAWQLELDPLSPKVGELAPDFELRDPEGVARVRLSDFRGQRPVALVFGSYT
jgi:hypothetical protein